MIGVVVSRADPASMLIRDRLLVRGDWRQVTDPGFPDSAGGGVVYQYGEVELREFEGIHVELEDAARPFPDPSYLVFASRHAGDSGPLLTTHFTGNFGEASLGGDPGTLALACPTIHSCVVAGLRAYCPSGYSVGIECTHHGPTDLDVPSVFVEIGSSDPQWRDEVAADAVAQAILSLPTERPESDRVVVGFGGGHYAPRFDRILRDTDWAVGHIAADWALEEIDTMGVIGQAFERSGAEYAVIDGEHPAVVDEIMELGYRVVSETFIRESTGVPLRVVVDLEREIEPVSAGLRFGSGMEDDWSYVVHDFPDELFTVLNGIDMERVEAVFREQTVAFGTRENGNRVVGPFAVANKLYYDALVRAVVRVLEKRFDSVTCRESSITVTEQAFDPALARKHNIPEGPAFGRLSNGEAVEIDGEPVTPDMVVSEYTERYDLGSLSV